MKNLWILMLLTSLSIFGQKQKVVYLEVKNSKEITVERKKDSIITSYDVLVKFAYELTNKRKSSEALKVISNEEYKKIKPQVLHIETIAGMSYEELDKRLLGSRIFIIDLTNPKKIKKISVKPFLVVFAP